MAGTTWARRVLIIAVAVAAALVCVAAAAFVSGDESSDSSSGNGRTAGQSRTLAISAPLQGSCGGNGSGDVQPPGDVASASGDVQSSAGVASASGGTAPPSGGGVVPSDGGEASSSDGGTASPSGGGTAGSGRGKPTEVSGAYDGLTTADIPAVPADEAGSTYVTDEVLVLFERSATLDQARCALDAAGLSADDGEVADCIEAGALCETTVLDGATVAAALEAVAGQDGVAFAQPNYLYVLTDDEGGYGDAQPADEGEQTVSGQASLDDGGEAAGGFISPAVSINDPRASSQWQLGAVNAYEAWDTAKVEGSVAVGIIDTGVMTRHEDLVGRVVAGYDSQNRTGNYEDDYGHGTHVSGIVAATTDNARGVSGVSYNASLIEVKADLPYGSSVAFSSAAVCEGFAYLLADADGDGVSDLVEKYNLRVVNMSIGLLSSIDYDPVCSALINSAYYDQGIAVVCAAGNDGVENVGDTNIFWPADYEPCISVISIDSNFVKSSSSNYGDAKDISAPGVGILSTTYNGGYGSNSGTSMASPVVAGIAALVFSQDAGYAPDDVRLILEATALDLGVEGFDAETAWGCVDAEAAVTANYGDNTITIEGGDYARISDGITTVDSLDETVAFGGTLNGAYSVVPDEGYMLDGFAKDDGTFVTSLPTGRITSSATYTAVCVKDPDARATLTLSLSDASLLQPSLCFSGDAVAVDWGDGETSAGTGTLRKPSPYAGTGTYAVTVTSGGSYRLGDGPTSVASSSYARFLSGVKTTVNTQVGARGFADCESLADADLSCIDVPSSTDLGYLFSGCASLRSVDLTALDVSSVTDMSCLFSQCSALVSVDLSGWDISRVTSMQGMFDGCTSLASLDLTSFDTSGATDMTDMFGRCASLRKVALGGLFSFSGSYGGPNAGRLCSLPDAATLSLGYEATGMWVDIESGEAYSADEVPNNVAATYYAQASTLPLTFTANDFAISVEENPSGSGYFIAVESDLLEGTEYTVRSTANAATGLFSVTITGVGNYAGSVVSASLPIPVADKSALEALIGQASALDGSDYTPASRSSLERALAAARTVDDDPDATQSKVDAVCADLEAAIAGLQLLFHDVTDSSLWYYDAVYGMAGLGCITGYYDDYYRNGTSVLIFNHGGTMDRAQMATVLWRMAGKPAPSGSRVFTDVDYSDYYGDAVDWAWEAGVVTGYLDAAGNLIYDPGGGLDFEALVTMAARMAVGYDAAETWPQTSLGSARFADADEISDWARGAMAWAIDEGMVTGSGEGAGPYYLEPGEKTARGRAVTVLWRAYLAGVITAS